METDWLNWLETKGPLWVMYAFVMYGIVKYGPILFHKHVLMLDTATKSMSESAQAITTVNNSIVDTSDRINDTHKSIAHAAIPASRAIIAITPPEHLEEVRQHLDEVVRILGEKT